MRRNKSSLAHLGCGVLGRITLLLAAMTCVGVDVQATGFDLVVPLEMLPTAVGSSSGGLIFNRSKIQLDPADYDGATYYFEIVGSNSTGIDQTVELVDASGGTVASVMLLSTDTATTRRRSSSFSPATGLNVYRIKLPSAGTNSVIVYSSRIIVSQVNATKTVVQIPLVADANIAGGAGDFSVAAGAVVATTSETYTQETPDKFVLWRKDASAWGAVANYRLEVLGAAWASFAAALWDATTNTMVRGSEVRTNVTSPMLLSTNLNLWDLPDGHDFELRFRRDSGDSGSAYLINANLYVKLTNLYKAETFLRFSRQVQTSSTQTATNMRQLLGTYSDPSVFMEATGREVTAGTVSVNVRDDGTNDSGTGGSNVTGGAIEFSSATKERVRTSSLSANVTTGNRYTMRVERSSGTINVASAFLVVSVNSSASTDTTAPSTPGNLSSSNVTPWSAQINWAASTDIGGSGLAWYTVFRGGVQVGVVGAGTTSFTDYGLTPQTTYAYTVSASDGAHNQSSTSSSINVTTTATTSLNLVVPIEMIAVGACSTGAATTFDRSKIQLNPSDYDGATYYFEVVGDNDSGANQTIDLVDGSGATKSSVTLLGTDTSPTRRRSASFTPTTGATEYRIKMSAPFSQLVIFNARIIVVQVSATKTAIQIPLVSDLNWTGVCSGDSPAWYGATDSTTSQTLTQANPDRYILWLKDAAKWFKVTGYRFDAVIAGGLSTIAEAALYDVDTNAVVTSSVLSSNATGLTLKSTTLAEPDLTDGKRFELRLRAASGSDYAYVATANLYIKLTNLQRAETYLRVSKYFARSSTVTEDQARQLLELTSYSAPTVYLESTGRESSSGTVSVNVRDEGTSDTTAAGTNVTGGSIEFTSATKQLVRIGSLSANVVSGDRYTMRVLRTSGSITGGAVFLVVSANNLAITNSAAPTVTSIVPLTGGKGTSLSVLLIGTNLNGATLSTTWTGLTFSNVNWDPAGTWIAATFNIASAASTGNATIQVSNSMGSTTTTFAVTPLPTLNKQYIYVGGRLIAVTPPQ